MVLKLSKIVNSPGLQHQVFPTELMSKRKFADKKKLANHCVHAKQFVNSALEGGGALTQPWSAHALYAMV